MSNAIQCAKRIIRHGLYSLLVPSIALADGTDPSSSISAFIGFLKGYAGGLIVLSIMIWALVSMKKGTLDKHTGLTIIICAGVFYSAAWIASLLGVGS